MIKIDENFCGASCTGNFCSKRAENGETVISDLTLKKTGYWKVDFNIVSSDSKYLQAIVLDIPKGFKGTIYACGKKLKKPKGAFAHIAIWEYCNPKEFSLYIELNEGVFGVSNGISSYNILSGKLITEPLGFCSRRVGGCALIPEKTGDSCFRLYCNDMDFDDDFNDFVFDADFTEIETKEEWQKLAKTTTDYEIKIFSTESTN